MSLRPLSRSCFALESAPTASSVRLSTLGAVAALAVAASGCQSMETPGQPLQPVAAAPTTAAAGVAVQADPPFPPADYEPMVLSSEELAANARKNRTTPPTQAAAPATPAAPATAAAGTPEAGASAPSDGTAAGATTPGTTAPADAPASAAGAEREELSAPVGSSWPVRLVSSLPDTQPPRAILGLPDGREIVVTAGSMIPDQGIVVMAIGAERVQLARIKASGDHAVITEESIDAQY